MMGRRPTNRLRAAGYAALSLLLTGALFATQSVDAAPVSAADIRYSTEDPAPVAGAAGTGGTADADAGSGAEQPADAASAADASAAADGGDEDPQQPGGADPEGGADAPGEADASGGQTPGETPETPEGEDPDGETPEEGEGSEEDPAESKPEETEAVPFSIAEMTSPLSAVANASAWKESTNKRLSGDNRYKTAVAVSKQTYPSGAATVIVATGLDFADSLSAAPLAAKLRAPLLLTDPRALSPETRTEIQRLKPKTILVVGGAGAVSSKAYDELKNLQPAIKRLEGTDRYATAVKVAQEGWPQKGATKQAFIATGLDYPDALAAGAAAGKLGIPVLLVPGNLGAHAGVKNELARLGATKIHIAGETGAVSAAMQKSLSTSPSRTVARYGGIDRYATASTIVNQVFSGSADVYWANGAGFADALTGAAAAGARGAALILVKEQCVPSNTYSATDRLVPATIYLLGGTGVLSTGVQHGNECLVRPVGISDADWSSTQRLYAEINRTRYAKGLAGFRVSDTPRGTPAYAWAKSNAAAGAKLNGSIASQQPWVRYQTAAHSAAGGDRAVRLFRLFSGNAGAQRWLLQPSSGVRGFVSVGYATSGSRSTAVLYIGGGLR